MENLTALLDGYFPNPDHQRLLIVGIAGAIAFLFAVGVAQLASMLTDPARRRLDALTPEQPGAKASETFASWVHRAADYVLPKKSSERETIHRQLVHAGYRSNSALAVFYGVKTCLAAALVLVAFIATRWMPQLSSSAVMFYVLLAAGAGLIGPNIVLGKLVERRQRRLRNGFPDALDMLVVCVEAGLGLTAAIQRVADELRFSHPELAAELALVNAETRAGVERETALKNLTDRTGLDDVRGLVSLLVQTLRFGTGIADTLRVYSEEFRDKRMQKAEELAAKIGTKLIFPLVLCLFPSFFVVAIGPAILRIIDALSQLGSQVVK
jgi:tight adherence protein C